MLQLFLKDLSGATGIEYALIATAIALAIAASVFVFGVDLDQLFDQMGTTTQDANAVVDTYEQVE